ncbi:hypothetical protein MKX08_002425 [Trichoderma sp. CBMAI-0020]|nr:hypothetical protein MKX08_002425 [Trichoderma sp. CBMAI-0020]
MGISLVSRDIKEEYKIKKLVYMQVNKTIKERDINGLGQPNSRVRRQQGSLTNGLRFLLLTLNLFQFLQIINPLRNSMCYFL